MAGFAVDPVVAAISTDAGGTFRRLKVRGRKVFAAVASPGDPGQVVALTRRGLFRSRLWWVVGNGPIAAHAAVYTRSLRG